MGLVCLRYSSNGDNVAMLKAVMNLFPSWTLKLTVQLSVLDHSLYKVDFVIYMSLASTGHALYKEESSVSSTLCQYTENYNLCVF